MRDRHFGHQGRDNKLSRIVQGRLDKAKIPPRKQMELRRWFDAHKSEYKDLGDDAEYRRFFRNMAAAVGQSVAMTAAQTYDYVEALHAIAAEQPLPGDPTDPLDLHEFKEPSERFDAGRYQELMRLKAQGHDDPHLTEEALDIAARREAREQTEEVRSIVRDAGNFNPDRLAEIRETMKTDYPKYANNRAMQSEYLELVAHENARMETFEVGEPTDIAPADTGTTENQTEGDRDE